MKETMLLLAGIAIGFIGGWPIGHWMGWNSAYHLFKENKVRPNLDKEQSSLAADGRRDVR